MLPRSPAPRRRGVPADGESRRFSPLNAPQRAAVDAFCGESRAWALRQAARTYRHLPEELREQAVDHAMQALRTGAPPAVDRRTLQAELAEELTEALRRVHVGWCLNQSAALWRDEPSSSPPAPPGAPAGARLADFVEEGLAGLERAVLQLEIGAGRDSRTVRAALRLRPREYARHREQGLGKLHDAITGQVAGHVCDHHLRSVVLAATGDRAAADALAAGPDRCRACSREAQGLRRLLHERLALAPWPFIVKPGGLIAVKVAAVGAALGGKSAGGAGVLAGLGSGSAGTSAGALTALIAAAAVATGGIAAVTRGDDTARPAAAPSSAPAAAAKDRAGEVERGRTGERRAAADRRGGAPTRAERRRAAARRDAGTRGGAPPAATTAPAPAATTVPAAAPPSTSAPGAPGVQQPVPDTVDTVRDAVGEVTKPVLAPEVTAPVDQALGGAQGAVDQVTGTVDGLLTP